MKRMNATVAPRQKWLVGVFFVVLLLFLLAVIPAGAQVVINFIAVNASEDEVKEIDVKYLLPPELDMEDILDHGELSLDYDVDKKSYYVGKKMRFNPKESRTFKVRVNDVWIITADEINILKNQINENLKLLEEEESYPSAVKGRDKMFEEVDRIFEQQTNYSDNIDRRIEEYRAYKSSLETIRNNAYDLDYLRYESKGLDALAQRKLVKFVIEVQNPEDQTKKFKQKHYLPDEIRADDVVEKKGFEVRFDEKKNRSYLTMEEEFGPKEIKKYAILMKDIWDFPMNKVDAIQARANIALEELTDTIYDNSAKYLFGEIEKSLKDIRETNNLTLPMEQHIGMYRQNEKRYAQAQKDCERLEKMMSIVRAQKIKDLEVGRVQNVLNRLKALRGLAALSEAIFKRGISVTATWRIIFGTLIFVAGFTAVHFIIWAGRSKRVGEEMGLAKGETMRVVPKPGEEEAGDA